MAVYVVVDYERDGCLEGLRYYRTVEAANADAEQCRIIKGAPEGAVGVEMLMCAEQIEEENPATVSEAADAIGRLRSGILFGADISRDLSPMAEQCFLKALAFLQLAECELIQANEREIQTQSRGAQ